MSEERLSKNCKKCNQIKPLSEFAKHKNKKYRNSYCRPCASEYSKEWRIRYPQKAKRKGFNQKLKQRYGITAEDYDKMFAVQQGLCAVCNKNSKLDVDHDHKTGVVRALLCKGCNVALGRVQDNPTTLRKLAEYLESFWKDGT